MMDRSKSVYAVTSGDILDYAQDELGRKLTEDEAEALVRSVEKGYDYLDWTEPVSFAIQDMGLEE